MIRILNPESLSCPGDLNRPRVPTGQTGRYLLVMRLRETERQLEAEDCPLQYLAQLGQLSADVQFILRRTGPSLDEGPHPGTRERPRPGSAASEPRSAQHRAPRKSSGSSSRPKRNNPNRSWSPSSRASPEPRASPVSFLSQTSSKEEVFRHVLLQQQQLQHLQALLQSLERETALWETDGTSAPPPGPDPALVEELEEQLRLNEAELLLGEAWEEELRAETDRERGTCPPAPPPPSSDIWELPFFLSLIFFDLFFDLQRCTDACSRCTRPWRTKAARRGGCSSRPSISGGT